jgi:choline monooxygenase
MRQWYRWVRPSGSATRPTVGDVSELTDFATPIGSTVGAEPVGREPIRIPTSRYTSAEFAALEADRLWPRTWLFACVREQVRHPGDFVEVEIGALSVLVVRGSDGELRAFQNACLHRGNQICSGSGHGLTELRCGYHRWCWDLEGRLREIPSRRGFGVIRNDEYGLVPVQVDTFGNLVFVNLDRDAEPLHEFLDPAPSDAAYLDPHRYACQAFITVPLPCNWKVAIEAFCETYHVQGIHREMLASTDDVNSPTRIWDRHGSLEQPYGVPSPRLRNGATDQEIWESFVVVQGERVGASRDAPGPHPPIPSGSTLRAVLADGVRATAAAKGADLRGLDDAAVLDLHQYSLFPNTSLVYLAETLTVIRARPGATPNDCFLDIVSCNKLDDEAWRETPDPIVVTMPPDPPRLNLIFNQDITNLMTAQRGLHQPSLTHITVSWEERRIANLHRNLDRVLGIDPQVENFNP